MNFSLIEGGHIRLNLKRDTPKEAGEFIKNEIAGNGTWKSLHGLDPDKCRLRVMKIAYDYYTLDGAKVEKID